MKRLFWVLTIGFLVLNFQNCGKSAENARQASAEASCREATVLGTWQSIDSGPADNLEFFANCRGTGSYCQSDFIYPISESSTVEIQINRTNGKTGCAPAGKNTCQILQFQPSSGVHEMTINCGQGSRRYRKN